MKPHFQCVGEVKSPSNLTKYCACHEILKLKISADIPWMLPPIERRFEDNPRIIRTHPRIIRTQNRHLAPAASETLLVPSWRRFCIVKYNISRSGYLPKCHEVLRLSRKVTRQPHQILRLPHKMTLQPHQILHLPRKINVISGLRHIWKLISNVWSHQILGLLRKMNVINDLRHIWKLISNAWSKWSHPPTSPNTAPVTKSWSWGFQRILRQ